MSGYHLTKLNYPKEYIKQLFDMYYNPLKIKHIFDIQRDSDYLKCVILTEQNVAYFCQLGINDQVFTVTSCASIYIGGNKSWRKDYPEYTTYMMEL